MPFSPEHLKMAMDRNITLLSFLNELEKNYDKLTPKNQKVLKGILSALGIALQIVPRFPKEEILKHLNVKYAYPWVLQRMPELKPILKTKEGLLFFKKQIIEFQKFFKVA